MLFGAHPDLSFPFLGKTAISSAEISDTKISDANIFVNRPHWHGIAENRILQNTNPRIIGCAIEMDPPLPAI